MSTKFTIFLSLSLSNCMPHFKKKNSLYFVYITKYWYSNRNLIDNHQRRLLRCGLVVIKHKHSTFSMEKNIWCVIELISKMKHMTWESLWKFVYNKTIKFFFPSFLIRLHVERWMSKNKNKILCFCHSHSCKNVLYLVYRLNLELPNLSYMFI